ncbi:MAG: DUF4160 domain-containing protein [Bacteroidales bacterium]|nr:DUF4160 domain-containing protein [Bacteroidales bacterium]
MPTLFVVFGFHFLFYSNDHCPIHIHVEKGDIKAKFTLFPVTLVENHGLKKIEIRLIIRVLIENQELIAEHWNTYFNGKQ